MTHVLITGGSGFIGSAVTKAAMANGCEVTLLNRGSRRLKGTEQLVADRNDEKGLISVLEGRRFDILIDTNAWTAQHAATLLSSLKGRVDRAVTLSSASVYRDDSIQFGDEHQPIGGSAAWGNIGVNKSAMEEAFRACRFLDYCAIIRPPYVFGTDNVADRETWFWKRQLNAVPVILPGDGTTPVQFVHKDDLAAAMFMAALSGRTGTDIFNVADPQPLIFSALASMLAAVAGAEDLQVLAGEASAIRPVLEWFPFRDQPCLTPPKRIYDTLGWEPKYSLDERFAQTFADHSIKRLRESYVPTVAERDLSPSRNRR